jgi:hypothetical protein
VLIDRQELLERLLTEIGEAPGRSARELKRSTGVDKSLINSVLYTHREAFFRVGERPPRWYLIEETSPEDGTEPDPDTDMLDAWALYGIAEPLTRQWRARGIEDARIAALWNDLQIGPRDALRLMRIGLGPAEAADFLDAEIELSESMTWAMCSMRRAREVADWRDAGFSAEAAQPWYELGFSAEEALERVQSGRYPRGWEEQQRPPPISSADIENDPATVRWDQLDLDNPCVHGSRIGACEVCAPRRPQLMFFSGGGRSFHAFPACEALGSGQREVHRRGGQVEPIEPTFRGSARLAERERRPCRACRPEG